MRSNRPRSLGASRAGNYPRSRRPIPSEEKKYVYKFPTNPEGKFAQAMSSIACNPSEGAKGQVYRDSNAYNSFSEQVSQALAIKLNLKTVQQANERALEKLAKEKTNNGV